MCVYVFVFPSVCQSVWEEHKTAIKNTTSVFETLEVFPKHFHRGGDKEKPMRAPPVGLKSLNSLAISKLLFTVLGVYLRGPDNPSARVVLMS